MIAAILVVLTSEAAGDAFAPLLLPGNSPEAICQSGIVTYQAAAWRQPQLIDPLANLATLTAEMIPPEISRLEAAGCNPAFLWGFIACSQSEVPSAHILPSGKHAETDVQMAGIMAFCLSDLQTQGVPPVK